MRYKNIVEYSVRGDIALFSDALTRVGGEKCSYVIPTYQALIGITESIFWKPTIIWRIDELRVMKPIALQAKGVRPINYSSTMNDLAIYTYLSDVEYRVRAYFEWNRNRPELEKDFNENKYYFTMKRMIKKGGRRDVFLGTRECQAYVEPKAFDEGIGAYDNVDEMYFGNMFHGFDYPDDTGVKKFGVRFWQPVMRNGIVKFCRPEECTVRREISAMEMKTFTNGVNFNGTDEVFNEEDGDKE